MGSSESTPIKDSQKVTPIKDKDTQKVTPIDEDEDDNIIESINKSSERIINSNQVPRIVDSIHIPGKRIHKSINQPKYEIYPYIPKEKKPDSSKKKKRKRSRRKRSK